MHELLCYSGYPHPDVHIYKYTCKPVTLFSARFAATHLETWSGGKTFPWVKTLQCNPNKKYDVCTGIKAHESKYTLGELYLGASHPSPAWPNCEGWILRPHSLAAAKIPASNDSQLQAPVGIEVTIESEDMQGYPDVAIATPNFTFAQMAIPIKPWMHKLWCRCYIWNKSEHMLASWNVICQSVTKHQWKCTNISFSQCPVWIAWLRAWILYSILKPFSETPHEFLTVLTKK